jgi:hypothetical protein
MALAQADSGTAPILVDELHAGGFQRATNGQVVRRCHGRFTVSQLGAPDRGNANSRLTREILSAPPN